MTSSLHVFQRLAGTWSFRRTISGAGTIEGIAVFAKSPGVINRLSYREDGVFDLKGQVHKVYKDYIYRYENEGISVYFDDGRHFHTLEFTNSQFPLVATADHHCVCDLYKAVYTFFHEKSFRVCYDVKGPKKAFTIETNFTKYKEDWT